MAPAYAWASLPPKQPICTTCMHAQPMPASAQLACLLGRLNAPPNPCWVAPSAGGDAGGYMYKNIYRSSITPHPGGRRSHCTPVQLQLSVQAQLLIISCFRMPQVKTEWRTSFGWVSVRRCRHTCDAQVVGVATCLGSHDTVVKYIDSNKSWVPGMGVVSPRASPASVDANPTNATARLTCVPEDTSPEAE